MPLVHTYDELVKLLTEEKVTFRTDAETQVVELASGKTPPLLGNIYVRWEKAVPFIQLIQFMVDDVPAERVHEVETAIVRLNNTLEVGGFGFDHSNRRMYCRLTLPVFAEIGIEADVIQKICNGVVRNALEFLDAFKAVIADQPGEQVIELYKARRGPAS